MNTWIAGKPVKRSDLLTKQQQDAPQAIQIVVRLNDGRQFGSWTGHPLAEYTPKVGELFVVDYSWGFGEETHSWQSGPYRVEESN